MPKKTVLKQICKLIPKDSYLNKAKYYDDAIEGGGRVSIGKDEQVEIIETTAREESSYAHKLKQAVKKAQMDADLF